MVLALPAANAPPISVTTSTRTDGSPRCASSMVGIVVTSRSSMIRGLVSANSERATARTDRRPARAGSAPVVAGVTTYPPCRHAAVAAVARRPRACRPRAPGPGAPVRRVASYTRSTGSRLPPRTGPPESRRSGWSRPGSSRCQSPRGSSGALQPPVNQLAVTSAPAATARPARARPRTPRRRPPRRTPPGRVTTRTGTDTSHHLASRGTLSATVRAGHGCPRDRPDACYGPDLLGSALPSATAPTLHDEIVIIGGAPAGNVFLAGWP